LLEKDLNKMWMNGDRRKVLLCFTTDPYQGTEEFNILTRKCLILFVKYGVPFQILTKGGMKAAMDFDLYSKNDSLVPRTPLNNANQLGAFLFSRIYL